MAHNSFKKSNLIATKSQADFLHETQLMRQIKIFAIAFKRSTSVSRDCSLFEGAQLCPIT